MNTQIKPYQASEDIEGNRFISFDDAEGVVKTANANSTVIGTTGFVGALKDKIVDVEHHRIVEVQLGGTVAQGDRLMSDANGKAIKATDETKAIAMALASGTKDAIIYVLMK